MIKNNDKNNDNITEQKYNILKEVPDDIYKNLNNIYEKLYNEKQTIPFKLFEKEFDNFEFLNLKLKFMKITFIDNIITFIMANINKQLWKSMATYILYLIKHYNIKNFDDIYINYNFNPNNKNPEIKVLSCGGNSNNFYEISWFMYYILNPKLCGHGDIGVFEIINKYFNNDIWKQQPEKLLIWRGSNNNILRDDFINYMQSLNNKSYDVQIGNQQNFIYMLDMYKSKYIVEVTGCKSNGHVGRKYFDFLTERVILCPKLDNHVYFFESQYYDCNIIEKLHYLIFDNVSDIDKIIKYIEANPEIYNNIQYNVRLYKQNHLKIDDLNNFSKKILLEKNINNSVKTQKICDLCKKYLKPVDLKKLFKKII